MFQVAFQYRLKNQEARNTYYQRLEREAAHRNNVSDELLMVMLIGYLKWKLMSAESSRVEKKKRLV